MTDLRNVLTASEASRKYGLTSRHIRYLVHNSKRTKVRGRWAEGVWLIDAISLKQYLATERKPGPKLKKKRI